MEISDSHNDGRQSVLRQWLNNHMGVTTIPAFCDAGRRVIVWNSQNSERENRNRSTTMQGRKTT